MIDPAVLTTPSGTDPALISAAREIAKARAQAKDTPFSPEEVDSMEQYVRQQTGGKYGFANAQAYLSTIDPSLSVENLARKGVTGASFGTAPLVTDVVFGKGAGEDWRARNEAFSREHPYISQTADMLGSLTTGRFLPLGAEPETVLGGMAKGGAVASTVGTVRRAAEAPPEHRLEAAADPLSLGLDFGLGAAVPGAVGAYKALTDIAAGGRTMLRNAVRQSGGPDVLKAKRAEFEAQGLEPTLADLSDPMHDAAKYMTQNSPVGRGEMLAITKPRLAEGPTRMLQTAQTMLSRQGPAGAGMPADLNAPAAEDATRAATSTWARGAYNALREGNNPVANTQLPREMSPEATAIKAELDATKAGAAFMPPPTPRQIASGAQSRVEQKIADLQAQYDKLNPPANEEEANMLALMKQPLVSRALAKAQTTGEIGDIPDPRDNPSFEKMFDFYQSLKSMRERAWASGDATRGTALREVENAVNNHLKTNVADYGDVSREYARRSGLADAFDTGHELFAGKDSRNIAKTLASMTPDEQYNARLAMASDVAVKLRNPNEASSFANKIQNMASTNTDTGEMENSLVDKLLAAFGDKPTLEQYMHYAKLNNELRVHGNYGGSDTYRNMVAGAGNQPPIKTAAQGMSHGLASSGWGVARSALIRAGASRAVQAIDRAQAEAMSGPLTARGPQIDAVLDEIMRRRSALPSIATQGVPAALSGLLTRQP